MKSANKMIIRLILVLTMVFGSSVCKFDTALADDNGLINIIDYSKSPSIDGYQTQFSGWSTQGTSTIEIDNDALKWTTADFGNRNTCAILAIPLENEIDTTKGEFTVSVKAKLSNVPTRRFRGFAILGGDMTVSDANLKGDNLMGMTQLNDAGYMLEAGNTALWMNVKGADDYYNIYTKNASDRVFMTTASAGGSYYTYKWVVNPQTKTFRFYYQKDGESMWIEPYADFYMKNTNTADENDLFEEKGVFPTGDLPSTIKSLKFRQYEYDANNLSNVAQTFIKNITVYQGVEFPKVKSVTFDSVEASDEISDVSVSPLIRVEFENEIDYESVNKNNFYFQNIPDNKNVSEDDYDVQLCDDNKTVEIFLNSGKYFQHSYKYNLIIQGVKSAGEIPLEMSGAKEVGFTTIPDPDAPDGLGGFKGKIDYSNMTNDDLVGYESGVSSSVETKTTFAIEDGVLKIKTVGGKDDNPTHYPKIPLNKLSIKSTDGMYSLYIKAKLYNDNNAVIRNFPILTEENTKYLFGISWCSGQNISADNLGMLLNADNRSDGMWTFKTESNNNAKVVESDNNVNIAESTDVYFMGLNEASSDYYTYRYDIDPESKTFRFYYQKDGETTWVEPYADFNMINPYTAQKGDRFAEKGVFPTGNIPNVLTHLQYEQRVAKGQTTELNIASIAVEQIERPKVLSVQSGGDVIENGTTDVIPDGKIDIQFDRKVRPDSVSKDFIYISDSETGERLDYLYDVIQTNDNTQVSIVFKDSKKLDYNRKYTLNISGTKAFTKYQGKMYGKYTADFTTLSPYAFNNAVCSANVSTAKINASVNLKDYVLKNNGSKYAVVAAVTEKDTNTVCAVKAVSDKSQYSGQIINETNYPFEFEMPEDFNAQNYVVKFYLWDSFVNSALLLNSTAAF